MPLSPSQYRLRLALAILLPLYMRIATASAHAVIASAISLITFLLIRYGRRPLDRNALSRLITLLTTTYLASSIADKIFRGAWVQLLMTYLMSWHAMRMLLSEERWVCYFHFSPFTQFTDIRQAQIIRLKSLHEMVGPALMTTCLTAWLSLTGHLKNNGVVGWIVLSAVLMVFHVGCVLQDSAVSIWRLVSEATHTANSKITSYGAMTQVESPRVAVEVRTRTWGRVTNAGDDLVEVEINETIGVSKKQGRPSTRRRG